MKANLNKSIKDISLAYLPLGGGTITGDITTRAVNLDSHYNSNINLSFKRDGAEQIGKAKGIRVTDIENNSYICGAEIVYTGAYPNGFINRLYYGGTFENSPLCIYYGIDNKGNIGIRTMTPAYPFDCNGNAMIRGNLTVLGNISSANSVQLTEKEILQIKADLAEREIKAVETYQEGTISN